MTTSVAATSIVVSALCSFRRGSGGRVRSVDGTELLDRSVASETVHSGWRPLPTAAHYHFRTVSGSYWITVLNVNDADFFVGTLGSEGWRTLGPTPKAKNWGPARKFRVHYK